MATADGNVVGRVIRPTSQEQYDQTYQETVECVPFASTIDAGAEWFLCHDPGDEVIEVAVSFFDDRGQALENLFYTESEVDAALASKAEASTVTTLQDELAAKLDATTLDAALDIEGDETRAQGPFVFASLTAAEIALLTPVAGMTLFNSTSGVLQSYNGSAWVDLKVPALDDLTDVDTSGVAAGDALVHNGTSWVVGDPDMALADLNDVTSDPPSDGDGLIYSGGTWLPGQTITALNLDDLADVDTTGKATGDALVWDGSAWSPAGLTTWMPKLASYRDFAASGPAAVGSAVLGTGATFATSPRFYVQDHTAEATSSFTASCGSGTVGTNASIAYCSTAHGYAVAGRKFRFRCRIASYGAMQRLRFGWFGGYGIPGATGRPASGFWAEYDRSVHATNLYLVCGDGTTTSSTTASSAVTIMAGAWVTFEFEFVSTSEVKLYTVSSGARTLIATHTLNIPSDAQGRQVQWFAQVEKDNSFGTAQAQLAFEYPAYDVDIEAKEAKLP